MKLTTKNTKGKIVKIKDCMGRYIPHCFAYNTLTREASLFIYAKAGKKNSIVTARKNDKGYVLKVKVVIPGSYAEVNGKRY